MDKQNSRSSQRCGGFEYTHVCSLKSALTGRICDHFGWTTALAGLPIRTKRESSATAAQDPGGVTAHLARITVRAGDASVLVGRQVLSFRITLGTPETSELAGVGALRARGDTALAVDCNEFAIVARRDGV